MFGSIYKGYSGLLGFSKGLDVLSNNVANLNSPGFKVSELEFRDLFYRYSYGGGGGADDSLQLGMGLDTKSTRTRFAQGELRQTDNPLDLAIDGNGFFVLRKDGGVQYSRAGQFEFDSEGYLVDRTSRARVAAFAGSGKLEDVNIAGLRVNRPQATTEVKFRGILSSGSNASTPTTYTTPLFDVFDGNGETRQLKITFTKGAATGVWDVKVLDQTDAEVHQGEVRYHGDGTPLAGFNRIEFDFTPDGGPTSHLNFNMGDPGTATGTQSLVGGSGSEISVISKDGFGPGALLRAEFDEQGVMTLVYSNGQSVTHQTLALAWFEDMQRLTQGGGGLFVNESEERAILGGADTGVMGKVVASKIELSNVELTEQFTDMVVIQRGYQASSQVISVANEMLQQLLSIRSRG